VSKGKSALGIVRKYHPQVNRVVEAKKDLHITVTTKDCRGAKSKQADSCAMARACEREYDGALISLSTAYIIKGDVAHRYTVPQAISREIVSFDRHHDFAPGDYKLKAPNKSSKLGSYRKRTLANGGGPAYRHDKEYASKHKDDKKRRHKTAGIRAL
jgi:hypothetical protein